MDLLSGFLALCYFKTFLCATVPRTVSVGCSSVLLICRLLRGMICLIALVPRILFSERQGHRGQAEQVLASMGERISRFDRDVNIARGASKGKPPLLTRGLQSKVLLVTSDER